LERSDKIVSRHTRVAGSPAKNFLREGAEMKNTSVQTSDRTAGVPCLHDIHS
jgi:hypothetical protein